jgi:serine protease
MPSNALDATRRTLLQATAGAVTLAGVAGATPGRNPGSKKNELLVGVSAGNDPVAAVEPAVPADAELVHVNRTLGYAAVRFPGDASDARDRFAERVTARDGVKYAEPNATLHALYTPNDPRWDEQYAPKKVNADDAWDYTLGSHDVTVSIVDQGIPYDHPELDDNICGDPGYDFVDDDSDPYPDDLSTEDHGTAVAGLAAGETDNGRCLAGISESCLLSARALDESGSGSTSDIADAIQWSADQGAEVINLSLGGGGYNSTMKNAVSYAYDQGSLLVAAAGGSATSSVAYPAAYDECLAVSALDSDDTLASYSNYGSEVELCAPGTNVLVLTNGTDASCAERRSGTSWATAIVSGCAALARDQWNVSNVELRRHLKATADDVGLSPEEQGCGRVDAYDAVATDPANSGSCAGGGSCGDRSTTDSVSDSLSGSSDSDCWYWNWEYGDPCRICIDLDGPSDADFDIYVNEGRATCPGPSDYDYRAITTDSQERLCIDDPDTSEPVYVTVDSYSGSGDYTLTITETAT